ncbi:hypothetical protein GOP47_0017334 [Adiantum capillus-veneris]|uniref:Ty3 transposon capsid-like protein domain-containing protein n=1 Tax=Adiantum capillus-veneris TaxID=13818 RepID=A0A9D4ZBN2_ADICA|nr:hypothetical protein GOP47_0017334 [Adiantum capillus-veneris]
MDLEAKEAVDSSYGLSLDRFIEAFLERFQVVEDADAVWNELNALKQGSCQGVDAYVQGFADLWTRWCVALKDENPPCSLKKSSFVDGLSPWLQFEVELKTPESFEDAVCIAKHKEWRFKRLEEHGISTG